MDPKDAGHVEFRLTGLDEKRVRRRLRDAGREWRWPVVGAVAARWPVLAAVAVLWIGGALPGLGHGVVPGGAGSVQRDPGAVVQGDRVLILADDSGSMRDDDEAPIRIRDDHITSLRRLHRIVEDTVLTAGWAMGVPGAAWNMVAPLETALARQREVDVVYFISDFAQTDDRFSSVEGRSLLWRLLSQRGIRLYVASVDRPVPQAWVQMAEQSGGAVIHQGVAFYRG